MITTLYIVPIEKPKLTFLLMILINSLRFKIRISHYGITVHQIGTSATPAFAIWNDVLSMCL